MSMHLFSGAFLLTMLGAVSPRALTGFLSALAGVFAGRFADLLSPWLLLAGIGIVPLVFGLWGRIPKNDNYAELSSAQRIAACVIGFAIAWFGFSMFAPSAPESNTGVAAPWSGTSDDRDGDRYLNSVEIWLGTDPDDFFSHP